MIAIIGGGAIGLAIGWRLAAAGRTVTVFERAEAGRAATWAAAGMLAPQVEAEPGEETLLPFLLDGRARWAGFAAEIEAGSGLAVDYRTEGTLVVAIDRDERARIQDRMDYLARLGLDLVWLSGGEAREREPHLARTVTAAIYSPLDHQVDNRKLVAALRAAFVRAGGVLREGTDVAALVHDGTRVAGIRVADATIAAETVVVAAGAWSRNIPGIPDDCRPPVRPVKGQMLALAMAPEAPLLRHVIWGRRGLYMVPRSDGRLIVGATVEEMGFDTTLTAGGQFELLRNAWETVPGIYDLPLVESWAGLRPGSRDDAPILGPTRLDGLVLATGHHRNGILLAPITADIVADYVLTGRLAAAAAPFTLERFTRRTDNAAGATTAGAHAGFAAEGR